MLEIQNISEKSKGFEKIKRLYERAFPYKERLPIVDLLEKREETTFCAVYENELFCGCSACLVFTLSHILHIWQLWNPIVIEGMAQKFCRGFMK